MSVSPDGRFVALSISGGEPRTGLVYFDVTYEDGPAGRHLFLSRFPPARTGSRPTTPAAAAETWRLVLNPRTFDPLGFSADAAVRVPAGHGAGSDRASPWATRDAACRSEVSEQLRLGVAHPATHAASRTMNLVRVDTTGPGRCFNPTSVRVDVQKDRTCKHPSRAADFDTMELLWQSRDCRKGRNPVAVPAASLPPAKRSWAQRVASDKAPVLKNIRRMFTSCPTYKDTAYWGSWAYTWGSVLFVMNGAVDFTKVAFPDPEPGVLPKYFGPWCYFVGALLYEHGAVVAYLEAINDGSFCESAMRGLVGGKEEGVGKLLNSKTHSFLGIFAPNSRCSHEHAAEDASDAVDIECGWRAKDKRRGSRESFATKEGTSTSYRTWRWWPTWQAVKTHLCYEMGYWAVLVQLIGVTAFGISAVVVLPGIRSSLQFWQEKGAFWAPQLLGSSLFLLASLVFMLEMQDTWWKPAWGKIGWWIGFWAAVGSVGFLLCAMFGFTGNAIGFGTYQSALSTSWGSTAYLISGLLQWYESTNRPPPEATS